MYIGPWQEYAIYRARKTAVPEKPDLSTYIALANQAESISKVRAELEKVLLESLDVESAKKALEAIKSSFENQSETTSKYSNDPHKLPNIDNKYKYPNRNINGYNRRSFSPKSSKSEPLPQLSFPKGSDNFRTLNSSAAALPRIAPTRSDNGRINTQPPYDSHAVVTLLRRERAQMNDSKVSAEVWQWSQSTGDNKTKKHQKLEKLLTNKISHLQKLKELYISDRSMNKETETVHSAEIKPTKETQDARPIINNPDNNTTDKITVRNITNLTPTDIEAVSKYFDFDIAQNLSTNASKGEENDRFNDSEKLPILTKGSNSILSLKDPIQNTVVTGKMDENRCIEGDSHPFDDLYSGGVDGLINWSLNLEVEL